jgi:hypothetical protein
MDQFIFRFMPVELYFNHLPVTDQLLFKHEFPTNLIRMWYEYGTNVVALQ